jgi:NAD(P)-dependent dehydrogenase (short-subunit alcohol dehydrogenase family)
MELQGQHAVVTGASRGIGAAAAAALEGAGCVVTRIARRWPDEGTDGGSGRMAADVTDETALTAALSEAAARRGAVRVLVNNAGGAESTPFARTDAQLVRRMLALNLESVFHATRAVLPGMLAAGGGRIINIASTAGLKGYAYVSAYAAAKHGVIGLTRSLALECARTGVTVNAVCPGYTETDLAREAVSNIVARTGRTPEQARDELAKANPQGRLVQPEEVAAAVMYLVGAAGVTGAALSVSGGETG